MTRFPEISDERRKGMLAPQPGRVRVVIDTDAANEVDDQFAITWGLLSPDRLDIEAIVAAPFSRAYFRESLLAAALANVDDSTATAVQTTAEGTEISSAMVGFGHRRDQGRRPACGSSASVAPALGRIQRTSA